jgi:NADH dehydrogenase [ubiquinone] 1 alpha subcomplex assembly factor 5
LPENIFAVLINHDKWPFKDNSVDCIVNNLYFHNTDSLEALLKKYQKSLLPDGCLLGNIFTYYTFQELKLILNLAEMEREGGVSPNVLTFPMMQEVGNLLGKLGFNLPSISINENRVYFNDLVDIFGFLKILGEMNFLTNRRLYKSHDTYIAAIALYQEFFNKKREELEESSPDLQRKITKLKLNDNLSDFVYLTMEITSFISWKYHESQQKPKERGSAEFNIKNLAMETLEKNDDPTLRIGTLKETSGGEFEIEETTERIKQQIVKNLGKEKVEEIIKSKKDNN